MSCGGKTIHRLLGGLALVGAATACGNGGEDDASSNDAVTSVENTPVKLQAIGNCWLYATAGWVESLHKTATNQDIDVSEAYWNFWYWMDQLLSGDLATGFAPIGDTTQIVEHGWWGTAAEIIYRYGWMNEKDFSPAADDRATQHEAALAYINKSIQSGKLQTAAARSVPQTVFEELVAAWQLSGETAETMRSVFNARAAVTTLHAGGTMPKGAIHAPQELAVLGSDGKKTVTLADAVGTLRPGTSAGEGARVGPEAWAETPIAFSDKASGATRRRALQQNIQAALNLRLAVPIAWIATNTSEAGVWKAAKTTAEAIAAAGAHESVLVDYEVDNVPSFGKLLVDVRETRQGALDATLQPAARVTFFRIKNSWGTDPAWTAEELKQSGITPPTEPVVKETFLPSKPGYNDLFVDYLDMPAPQSVGGHVMMTVALPPSSRFPLTGPTAGCYSASLDDTVGDGICIQSKKDQVWYVCTSNAWKAVSGGSDAQCGKSFPLK